MLSLLLLFSLLSATAFAGRCYSASVVAPGEEFGPESGQFDDLLGVALPGSIYSDFYNYFFFNTQKGVPFSVTLSNIDGGSLALYAINSSITIRPSDTKFEFSGTTFLRIVPADTGCYAFSVKAVKGDPNRRRASFTISFVSPAPAVSTSPAPTPTSAPTTPCAAFGGYIASIAFSGSRTSTASLTGNFQYFYYNSEAGVPFSVTTTDVKRGSLTLFASLVSAAQEPTPSTAQFNGTSFKGTSFLEITPKSNECYAIGARLSDSSSSDINGYTISFISSKDSVLPCSLYKKLGETFASDINADTISLPPLPNGAISYNRYYYNAVAGVPFAVDVKITSVGADLYVSRASVIPFPDVIKYEYFSAKEGNQKVRILPPATSCYAVAVLTYQIRDKPTVVDVSFATERVAMPEGDGKPCSAFGAISLGEGYFGSTDIGGAGAITAYADREIQYWYYNGQAGIPFSFTANRVGGGSLALYAAFATVTPVPIATTAQFTGTSFLQITPKKDGCFAIGVQAVATGADKKTLFKGSFLSSKDSTTPCGLYRKLGIEYSGDARTEVITIPASSNANPLYLRYLYNTAAVPFTVDVSVTSVDADLYVSRAAVNALPDANRFENFSAGAGSDKVRIVPSGFSCYAIGVLVYQVPDAPTVLQVAFKPERATPI